MHFFGMSCNLPANEKEKHLTITKKHLAAKKQQNLTNHSEKNIRNEMRGSCGV